MRNDLGRTETLHPALDRVLAGFQHKMSARAAVALQRLLHERLSGGLSAWASSRLTGDGFPVEITFTSADQRLRYTVEPATPQATPQQRLVLALQDINALSLSPIPSAMAAAFRRLQHLGDLSFGAWVGGRHSLVDDQFKLYVEMPMLESTDSAAGELTALLGEYPQPGPVDRLVNLRMLAWSPGSAQWELYYRIGAPAPHHLAAVLAPAGYAAQAGDLLRYLREAYGHSFAERLPGESVGVSYTWQPGQAESSVTLFFFARTFWGGDARIRQQFGSWSTALGWNDRQYQRITAPLAGRRVWKTFHGILGVSLLPGRQLALSIGVRPPEASADDQVCE